VCVCVCVWVAISEILVWIFLVPLRKTADKSYMIYSIIVYVNSP